MVIIDQGGSIFGPCFFENMFAVAFYGFITDEYFFGNLLIGISQHDQSKNFNFAKGEFVVFN